MESVLMRTRKAAAVAAILFTVSGICQVRGDEKITTETVLKAWRKREQQTPNFEFRWKESRTYGKGSQFVLPSTTRSPSPTAKNDGGTQKRSPPKDVTQ